MTDQKYYDVIIIGGSYAGLSAAMALGRSLRNVLIIDSGLPCNRQTPEAHNFITHDGAKPSAITEKAMDQVLKYDTIKFHAGLAVDGRKTTKGFAIGTQSGEEFHAKKLIFATGIKDKIPEIKGFSACWGISIVHCPYCHGYEYRHQKTGILINGDRGFHLASLVNNLTDNTTIITSGKAEFTAEQVAKLDKHKIQIIEKEIVEVLHDNGHIKTVIFDDGDRDEFSALYAALPFEQHSDLPISLGCDLTELGYIKVDQFQKTSVSGIYACGDNCSMMRSISNAVATGNMTGAVLNNELTVEEF